MVLCFYSKEVSPSKRSTTGQLDSPQREGSLWATSHFKRKETSRLQVGTLTSSCPATTSIFLSSGGAISTSSNSPLSPLFLNSYRSKAVSLSTQMVQQPGGSG